MHDDDKRRVFGCGFAAAIVLAPFLALFYGEVAGLVVLALALVVTLFGVFEAGRQVETAASRRRLRALAVVNGVFLVVVLVVLGLLIAE